jgi:preprotein translocase subunit YajC
VIATSLLAAFQNQAPAQGPGASFLMFQLFAIVMIAYFFFTRPSRKREKEHQDRLSRLRKGDEVVTAGGLVGKIVHLTDDRVTVKSDESRFVVVKSRITDILTERREEAK